MLTTVLTVFLMAMTPVNPGNAVMVPPSWGGGGPDDYGYTYLDSDTTCPGAPTYSWVEISGAGTEVTGLGDDNIVGPFDIGFDFPYYWYTVSQFYVGSNGYIAFHDNTMAASPFPPVPGIQAPNNTLAPLLTDFDPGTGGSVYYWTNSAADTCIVQFDGVPFWSTGGSNTFEIILSLPDSTITFQYKQQTGTPQGGWNATNNQTGIENVSGSVGVNYLSGANPPGNMYHADLAVRFIPPESTSYEVHDAGIRNAMNDRNGGFFALSGSEVSFWAVAKNFGNQSESDFWTYVQVKRAGTPALLTDSILASVPNAGDVDSLEFTSTWTPATPGIYSVVFYTKLAGDMLPTNDTVEVECQVITLPGTLTFDKGDFEALFSWNGPGGYGMRFVPPVYPCGVTGIRVYAGPQPQSAGTVNLAFGVFDDNGPGGGPGDTLFLDALSITEQSWHTINLPQEIVVTEGAFFVGGMSAVTSEPVFGADTIPPFSGQTWEYTGVWSPGRNAWTQDIGMNAMVATPGVSEWLEPAPVPRMLRLDVSPNPFDATAKLRLLNGRGRETAIEVYDAAGCLVRQLELTKNEVLFDGRDAAGRALAGGVYFACVAGTDAPVAKLVINR